MKKKQNEVIPDEVMKAAKKDGFEIVNFAGTTAGGVKYYSVGFNDCRPVGLPCYYYIENAKVKFFSGFLDFSEKLSPLSLRDE